ncbi:Monocarboxylate permease-like protein [Mycena indigotica]|uniref:Monocarboxylate permease-like protein n=1 Tax=Mycena indigotica TaxID=2126181 RepID=A0A8H6S0P3_9AGAR|nr:Monocarboxylate permease-like protein [Mycena indigotica]KAF7290764.1 Monocarboxylate permease-like protein [Mycena indigotica]
MSSAHEHAPSPTTTAVEKTLDTDTEAGQMKPPINVDPPDGGVKAWLTILGVSCVSIATFGTVNGYGAFNDYYQTTYLSNYSPTLVSMIGAIQVFMLYVFASVSGALFDALGPRLMIPISGLVSSFAMFMLSISQPQRIYQQYLTQAVLFSLGATFAFFPSIAVCAHWFKRKLAFALGFPIAAASLGGIVYPIMLDHLIPKIGFGWTIRILAFIVLFCFIVGSLTITTPRPPKPLPKLSQLLAFHAFRDPTYLCLCLGGWFSVMSIFNPFFYVGLYGEVASGGPSKLTPYYLAILCATAIVGRILPGFIADRVGRYNVMAATTLISGVLILAMWYTATEQPSLIAFSALYGFFSGPFFALFSPCIVSISPIHEVGARIGMSFGFMSTAAIAGTPIGGVFIRTTTVHNFRHLILYSGVFAVVGSVFFCAARVLRSRKLWAAV